MSKGTPVRPVRIPDDEWAAIESFVNHRNLWSDAEPWNMSDFIRIALKEKMAKMIRSRRSRGRSVRRGKMSGVILPTP